MGVDESSGYFKWVERENVINGRKIIVNKSGWPSYTRVCDDSTQYLKENYERNY
jgi:hypothetical protein